MTVTAPVAPKSLAVDDCTRLRLQEVTWDTYVALRDAASNNGVRMVYDNGDLLLTSPGFRHGRRENVLSRLVQEWTLERGLPLCSGGNLTMREEQLKLGLEPDNCFWIANESAVRETVEWSPAADPPPDLVVEVDVTSDSLVKLGIYAGLHVPEVWHHDGERLRFLELVDGEYAERPHSLSFPELSPDDLWPFLARMIGTEENTLIREFRGWVRARFGE